MDNFEIEKYGYNKEQVDKYITDLVQDNEVMLREQKTRISDLKRELQSANEQLETYKQKNENISKVALLVFKYNEAGNAFWEKQGFILREDINYRNIGLRELIRIDT